MGSKKRNTKFTSDTKRYLPPKNAQQKLLEESIWINDITVVAGAAGTGKTLLSVQALYRMYERGMISSIKIIRGIQDTFGENLGALPGSKSEKMYDFAGPILDNLLLIIPEGELKEMFSNNKIEIIPVSRVRGRSFAYTGVVIEEAQNLSEEMIICCITRISEGSTFIFNGDPYQSDFYDRNGINYVTALCQGIEGAGIVELDDSNIVRHPIIEPILSRARELGR